MLKPKTYASLACSYIHLMEKIDKPTEKLKLFYVWWSKQIHLKKIFDKNERKHEENECDW
jgi:hypothetical protein